MVRQPLARVVMFPTPAAFGTPSTGWPPVFWAGFGYVVLLPDVYYRVKATGPFDMKTAFGDPQERARIMFMIGTLTPDRNL